MEKKEKVFILKESEAILLLKVATLATLGHLSEDDVEKLRNLDEDLLMYAIAAARASRSVHALEKLKELLKSSEEDCED